MRKQDPHVPNNMYQQDVHGESKVAIDEVSLVILNKSFHGGSEPSRLVVGSSGEVRQINGFPGMEEQLTQIVSPAVLEFRLQARHSSEEDFEVAIEALITLILSIVGKLLKLEVQFSRAGFYLPRNTGAFPDRFRTVLLEELTFFFKDFRTRKELLLEIFQDVYLSLDVKLESE